MFRARRATTLKRFKQTRRKLGSYNQRLPFKRDAGVHIAIVGSEARGLAGQGKTRPDRYFPKFEYGADKAGATVVFYQTPRLFMQSLHVHDERPLAVVFLYNEEQTDNYPPEDLVRRLEDRPRTIVYNSPEVARKIAEKPVTNRILSDAGIDVPRMLSHADIPIFSNTKTGSHQPTSVVTHGKAVDPDRYNTELIDTCVAVNGCRYFVSLRAMCVVSRVQNVFVRCRPVEDGTPNVHSRDTPLDSKILTAIWHEHVTPRMDEIHSLCANIASVLGSAFYSHDILLANDGRLPVCEVGWKWDDATLLDHLWPVSSELDFMRGAYMYDQAEECARVVTDSVKTQT